MVLKQRNSMAAKKRGSGPSTRNTGLEKIRKDILEGVYRPGHVLSEMQIAQELKCTRTPVREALARLETEGLIEILPRLGARVQSALPRDYRDWLAMSIALEMGAASELARLKNEH